MMGTTFQRSLRLRLILLLLLIGLPAVVMGPAVWLALDLTIGTIEGLEEEVSTEMRPVQVLQTLLSRTSNQLQRLIHQADPDGLARLHDLGREAESAFGHLAGSNMESELEQVVVEDAADQWYAAWTEMLALAAYQAPFEGQPEAMKRLRAADFGLHEAVALLDKVHDLAREELREEVERARTARLHFGRLVLVLLAGGLLLAALAAASLIRAVLGPLGRLGSASDRLARGNLDYRLAPERFEEFDALREAFNRMAVELEYRHDVLHQQAVQDGLTGLLNHTEFLRRLAIAFEAAREAGEPLSLLMVDLDHFKRVNDTYGHPAGDAVLRAVAATIQRSVLPTDTVGRYGGEEFALLLPQSDVPEAEAVARRIRLHLERTPVALPNGDLLRVTASAGIATAPRHAASPAQLVERADQALYQAKRDGRDCVRVCCAEAGAGESPPPARP